MRFTTLIAIAGLSFGIGTAPRLYLIDMKTGFETTIAKLPLGLSSGLELVSRHDEE